MLREYFVNGGVGLLIALTVFLLAVIALFGGIPASSGFLLLLIAGCALSRVL